MDNKELASMFARYWGAKCQFKHDSKPAPERKVNGWVIFEVDRGVECKLILKQIEDISDEDGRYVAAIPKNSIQSEAERIDYLRSKGYDIDNLIPRGYAVDEKEVKCD